MRTVYIPLRDARVMLRKRCNLRREVEQWWHSQGWFIPNLFFESTPIAAFGRAIATRRYEDALFLYYAKAAGLKPIWMEYTNGVFSSHSPFKRSLLQPIFYERHGKNGGLVSRKRTFASIQENRTKKLSDIHDNAGNYLVDYHHRLHAKFGLEDSSRDFSEFYGQFGNASGYYLAYLSLFVAHAIMFEDYHGGEDENTLEELTNSVFHPAYESLESLFGAPLLLVHMPWHENLRLYIPEDRNDWQYHGVIPKQFFQIP